MRSGCCLPQALFSPSLRKDRMMRICNLALAPAVAYLVIAAGAATLAEQPETQAKAPPEASAEPRTAPPKVAYTCPMHPQVIQAKPGACPLCRMALKPTKAVVAESTESASGSEPSPMDHKGMSMSGHEDMQGTQMGHDSMNHGMCGCGKCMSMTGMEGMDHGSASATAKPAPQRSYGNVRSGGRSCGC